MKVFKYVLMFILIASTMALAGCGGDKFAGKWYAMDEEQGNIRMLDITKNGENYIIKNNNVFYKPEYKEVGKETIEKEENDFNGMRFSKVKKQYQVPAYEVTLNLMVKTINQTTEVENKGQLGNYTYIEKDKTLQLPSSMGKVITYKQGNIKDLVKKMQTTTAAFYDKAKAGEVKILVKGFADMGRNGGNVIKDYKFNENIPKDLE